MHWTLLHPLYDVDDVIAMARGHFESEVDQVLTTDPGVFRHHLTVCSTNQLFDKGKEFIAVCRDDPVDGEQGRLLGYCWFDRGGYTTYSREEISNAKFHHVDMTLPVKTRVRLINEMIDQHVLWANAWKVPVICSTSIRGDQEGFMKIHEKRGFSVRGSYAWVRTEKAMELLNERRKKGD